jgi:ABC-type glycerol-3-phosphate transport system permease component
MSTQTTPVLPRTGTVAGGASAVRRLRRALQQVDLDKNLILLILGILTFTPLVVMVFMSGKDQAQWFHERFSLSLPWHWGNYTLAWEQIAPYMKNSFIVTIVSCAGVLALSCIGGFVFARYNFPGKEILWYAILALLMVPGILTLIPTFILVKQLHLLNTLWALILPYISAGQVFGMFLLRSFFASLPEEMFESARMDGAGDMTMLWRLAVPLSSSILGTLAILQVLSSWNDLIWPSVTLQEEGVKTLVLGLWQFQTQYYTNWGPLMAGYVLASIPLILMFAFTSRLFVKGLSSGAIKM